MQLAELTVDPKCSGRGIERGNKARVASHTEKPTVGEADHRNVVHVADCVLVCNWFNEPCAVSQVRPLLLSHYATPQQSGCAALTPLHDMKEQE